ncbi:hypothetical protein NHQ30_008629 [Ciborinia camelliae]|nr:hypothetical protein NHQ30_008629 [Ciborinia camelliae]
MILESEVQDALENPHGMEEMYKNYAEKFEKDLSLIGNQIATRTMALLASNAGSMTKKSIIVALSLNANNGKLNPITHRELTEDPFKIARFCNHLVQVNENRGIIGFCHKTVFDFFVQYKSDINYRRIAELCLLYLSSLEFSQGPQIDATWCKAGGLGPILQKHPFLLFASSKWAMSIKKTVDANPHAKKADIEKSLSKVLNLLKILFGKGEAANRKINLQLAFQVHLHSLGKAISNGVSHEHILSYFSLFSIFDIFKDKNWFDVAKSDDDGLRPIHWALRSESDIGSLVDTVTKLIQYGQNINEADDQDRTPIYYAAYYGCQHATKLLIEEKAKLDIKDKNEETALIAACRKHYVKNKKKETAATALHEEEASRLKSSCLVVSHLVKAGANVKVQSIFGTALQAISSIGCCACAKRILQSYGNSKVVESCGPLGISLHAAAYCGHLDLVKLLCSRQTNRRATDKTYGSPVTAAVAGFNPGGDLNAYLKIIEELIDHGVDVNNQSGMVGPALRMAAYQGCSKIVRLLLNRGAEVRNANGKMGTAYEAATERGHQKIRAILLERDANAAHYGVAGTPKTGDWQQFQRRSFMLMIQNSNMGVINSIINQFENQMVNETEKDETKLLESLINLGENIFRDITNLVATNIRSNLNTITSKQKHDRMSLPQANSRFCEYFRNKKGRLARVTRLADVLFQHPRRRTGIFVQFNGEHLKVLDLLTEAAVNILESAILHKERDAIELIANKWVDSLNNLFAHPEFGEQVLESVVQNRADEVKEYLKNTDQIPEKDLDKADLLGHVAMELLLVAVGRGPEFKHLSFIISKLWMKAVNDVEDLAENCQASVKKLIGMFGGRFSNAIKIRDAANAEIIAHAIIELLRALALSRKKILLERFSGEWVIKWGQILEAKMDYMAEDLFKRRYEEYQECLKNEKHDEALSLTLASMEVLRAAFEQGSDAIISSLQTFIESGFQLARQSHTGYGGRMAVTESQDILIRDLGCIFDAIVTLFAAGEKTWPNRLSTLASLILDHAGLASGRYRQEIIKVVKQRIVEARRIFYPAEREKLLLQIYRTLTFLLEVALSEKERNLEFSTFLSNMKVALGDLKVLPSITKEAELVSYIRATGYLKEISS